MHTDLRENGAITTSTTLTLGSKDVDLFREVLRQQLLGDEELMRDAIAGREDPEIRLGVYDRMKLVRRLGDEVGLGRVVDRRRARSVDKRDGYVRVSTQLLVCLGGILLSTAAVYAAMLLGVGGSVVIYVPVMTFATLHWGRRNGVLTAIGCVLAYVALDPLSHVHDVGAAITLVTMLLSLWLIRRDVF